MVTPCASSLEGTWFYETACADDPLADLRSACASISMVSSTSTLAGRIDFVGTSVARQVQGSFSATVNLPQSCATRGCAAIQVVLRLAVPGATCVGAAAARTGCDCTFTTTSALNENGTWSADGGVVSVVTPSKTRTFDTCVGSGTTLSLRETTPSLPATEKGTTSLTKR